MWPSLDFAGRHKHPFLQHLLSSSPTLTDIYSQVYIFSQYLAAWDVRWPVKPQGPIILMGWCTCSPMSRPSILPGYGFGRCRHASAARGDARLGTIQGRRAVGFGRPRVCLPLNCAVLQKFRSMRSHVTRIGGCFCVWLDLSSTFIPKIGQPVKRKKQALPWRKTTPG